MKSLGPVRILWINDGIWDFEGTIQIYVRFSGRAVAPHQQENTHFSIERGIRTMNWV
jgi:hypothetical protein